MNKLKNKLFSLFEFVNTRLYSFLTVVVSQINKFRKKPRVLVFTDSRGFEVTKFWNRKNPFSSYIGKLILNFDCTVQLCPHKFTSLIDFLVFYKNIDDKDFDKIILHCGIVDFAPRPESSFDQMYSSKLKKIEELSVIELFDKKSRLAGDIYAGEKTYSFMDEKVIRNFLIPELKKIPEIIYVSINPVLDDWQGNYWRSRPVNINNQLLLDSILKSHFKEVIDLSNLNEAEIKTFTSDNVHYTKIGFLQIYKKLKPLLPVV